MHSAGQKCPALFWPGGRDLFDAYGRIIFTFYIEAEIDAMAELDFSGEDITELVRLTTRFSNCMKKL